MYWYYDEYLLNICWFFRCLDRWFSYFWWQSQWKDKNQKSIQAWSVQIVHAITAAVYRCLFLKESAWTILLKLLWNVQVHGTATWHATISVENATIKLFGVFYILVTVPVLAISVICIGLPISLLLISVTSDVHLRI